MMRYLDNVATLKYDESKCSGCGRCEEVCPHRIFKLDGEKAFITDKDLCIECGGCMMNCPAEAIDVNVGVGCAAAVIGSMINKNGNVCC